MTEDFLHWRTSTHSGQAGTCVEVAQRRDGHVLVRNSNNRDSGTLSVGPTAMAAWVFACRAGDLDDLAI
jgi:hypothetical protein